MTFKFSARSLKNLEDVHPDLVRVVTEALAISPVDYGIIEGVRTVERQKRLFDTGASHTMKSRHLHGFAVDFMCFIKGVGTWEEKYYGEVAGAMAIAAEKLGIPIVWGGSWTSFKDEDHIELDKNVYPDPGTELIA